jgi:putative glutamine amidotransferase
VRRIAALPRGIPCPGMTAAPVEGMRRRPLIGVTGPDTGGIAAWLFTRRAVRRAGGRPLRITPDRGPPGEPLHGLILGGGADVGEELSLLEVWQAEREAARGTAAPLVQRAVALAVLELRILFRRKTPSLDAARDRLEGMLLQHALERGMPVLGICRGAQLLNVVMGGSLHRDLSSFYVEQPNIQTVLPRKRVTVEPGSRLARSLGVDRCAINSLHRNAIDRVAAALRVVAREDNGLVQAIERSARPFVLGVQWHPEYLPQRPEQVRLFEAFVREAARYQTGEHAVLRRVA